MDNIFGIVARLRVQALAVDGTLLQNVQTASGAHSTYCSTGIGSSFPEVKRPMREAEESTP
jgi:hypothetical protein